jgi:hypothetical protein
MPRPETKLSKVINSRSARCGRRGPAGEIWLETRFVYPVPPLAGGRGQGEGADVPVRGAAHLTFPLRGSPLKGGEGPLHRFRLERAVRAIGSRTSSGDAGQHLFGQQHEGLVAERRAQQIVEADLVVQPQDFVADLVGGAVQDHLVEVALDRVDASGRK